MLLLRSKFERACLVVGVVGFTVFGIGLYGWFQDANHSFTKHILDIPNYPPDFVSDSRYRTSFVQHYHSCEWTSTAPPSGISGPTVPVVTDQLLSLEPRCMSSILDAERSTQKKLSAEMNYLLSLGVEGLSIPMYGVWLAWPPEGKALSKAVTSEDINPGGGTSDDHLYKIYVRRKFMAAGWPKNISDQVYEKCLVAKEIWCVRTQQLTDYYFLSIIKANASLLIGVILLTVGFAGAFFSGPLKWVWHISFGRVLAWIKGE